MVVKVCGWKAAFYIIADQDVEKGLARALDLIEP